MDTGTLVLGAGSILMWLVDRSERKREVARAGARVAPPPRALPARATQALQPPPAPPARPPAPPPPPPVTFTPEQAGRFTEAAPSGGRRFVARFADGIPTWLGARGAQRVSLGQLPGEAWLVVPLMPGMPVAESLIAERVSSGRSCLGSLSYVLLPGGRPVATLLVFVTPEAARSMSEAPSDFAILAEPVVRVPVAESAAAPAEKTEVAEKAVPAKPRAEESLETVSFDEETSVLSRALLAVDAPSSSSDLSPFTPSAPPSAHGANGIAPPRENADPAPAKTREAE